MAFAAIRMAIKNFNPLPPCGGRHGLHHLAAGTRQFQSTPSVWRETTGSTLFASGTLFQSTPSVWRETLSRQQRYIEALISIHSLRVEGDASAQQQRCTRALFQSTPSVWRETASCAIRWRMYSISIHSLRVEGDEQDVVDAIVASVISIHSLRVEGDDN